MKKFRYFIIFVFSVILLSSCGYDTRDWPRIDLPFLSDDVVEVEIFYKMQPKGKSTVDEVDHLTISAKESIGYLVDSVRSYPYKEKIEKNIDKDSYWVRVEVKFKLIEGFDLSEYKLIYYGYGVTNGYIVLDSGSIHFLPGDFVTTFYTKAKKLPI